MASDCSVYAFLIDLGEERGEERGEGTRRQQEDTAPQQLKMALALRSAVSRRGLPSLASSSPSVAAAGCLPTALIVTPAAAAGAAVGAAAGCPSRSIALSSGASSSCCGSTRSSGSGSGSGMSSSSSSAAAAAAPGLQTLASRGVHSGNFKTKSSIKKRFRVKPNGSITRAKCGRRHLNMNKGRAHVNRLGKESVLTTAGIRKKYLRILKVSPMLGARRALASQAAATAAAAAAALAPAATPLR